MCLKNRDTSAMHDKIENIIIRYRIPIAILIMLASLAGIFIIGLKFDLFGQKIDFIENPANYLFFGCILLGIFGVFYSLLRAKLAFIATLFIAAIYTLIFIAGKLSRGEI